jgi:hypothetical protein
MPTLFPEADIDTRVERLLALSRHHSEHFCSDEATAARQAYLKQHPSRIVVMKCMDGRIHVPHATRTPMGIIQPFRNLGGIFDLGWPYLGEMLCDAVTDAAEAGRDVLMLITYHFSRGERSRGCAGFGCDADAARRHAEQVRGQAKTLFAQHRRMFYPLVAGFETDTDTLILHNAAGEVLDVATLDTADADSLGARIDALFPDMPATLRADLLPLVSGNLEHALSLRGVSRELDIEHREWVICVGRGFDFLHVPNTALIVGPYSPDLSEPIGIAASIIDANMRCGRIADDGFLLLSSAPYEDPGVDEARARLKSRFLLDFAREVIQREHPALAKRMLSMAAVVHWSTRRLSQLD